jgi:hypothetical protein
VYKAISRSIVLLFFVLTISLTAQQHDPIVTDRPDQTESAAIVPAGWLQIEAGAVYEEGAWSVVGQDYGSAWTTQVPGLLLRFGVNDHFELRLGGGLTKEVLTLRKHPFDNAEDIRPDTRIDTLGIEPFAIGMKAALSEENGLIPQSAVLLTVGIPGLGSEWFDIAWPAPEIRFAFAHTLSDMFSLGYNLGIAWDGSSPVHAGYYSIALGAGLSEAIGAYVEVYGDLPGDMQPLHRADAGVTYLLNPDLQLDLSAGIGLNEPAPDDRGIYRMDSFVGAGFSWRFPVFR